MSSKKQLDALGDRMKTYEKLETSSKFIPGLPIYVRIDGRGFSKFTKQMTRPYDQRLSFLMQQQLNILLKNSMLQLVMYNPMRLVQSLKMSMNLLLRLKVKNKNQSVHQLLVQLRSLMLTLNSISKVKPFQISVLVYLLSIAVFLTYLTGMKPLTLFFGVILMH